MSDPIIVGNNDLNKNKIPNYSTKIPNYSTKIPTYSKIDINNIGSINYATTNMSPSTHLIKPIGNSYGSYVSTPYPNRATITTHNRNLTPLARARAKSVGGSRKRKRSRRRSIRRRR